MQVGPGHPWYFKSLAMLILRINRSSRRNTMALLSTHCQHRRLVLFPPLTYVLLWMSMAQRQRTTDEHCQSPKVRAWRPFTVQQKQAGVVRRVSRVPSSSSSFTGGVREMSLQSPWLGKVQALMLHVGTRRNGKNSEGKRGSPPFQMPTGWANSKSRNLTNSPLWQLFLG